ncbi:uncharacterized protein EV420DRAFT_87591 [Desarmillaria tabescens]|uniref:Uncharacterized protein n=1 Tax=Armillaria tabescens TaxID=1929756 RepID=A0AA39NQM0_ARMTA|nr:uncharacterized protein EV420DRAFT_87591 [Desarmillaria tabescens]KAK0470062.1 hypothetical protein EV420DRAFT_87591 [Desarmillaria tabescens]
MPRRRTWIFIGIGAITVAALTPVIVPPILGWFGFGAAGPVAGGMAAGIQSGIGNVAAGSLFAHLQSMAMGGIISAVPYVASGIFGGFVGWAVDRILRWFGW